MRNAICALTLVWLTACAAPVVLPPAGVPPRYPDLIFPELPMELQQSPLTPQHNLAWRWLQVGDLRNAEQGFAIILKQQPAFYPAQTGLGLVKLTAHDNQAALTQFDAALARAPQYVPALVGRGEAELALKRDAEALRSFQAALAVDPTLTLSKSRVEVLQFRLLQASLAAAHDAAAAGRADEAIAAYQEAIAASPQSAFLYREIAGVERRRGDLESALEHYRKAAELEPSDASAWRNIGEIFETRGNTAEARDAYRQSAILEPGREIQARLARVEAAIALAALPPEYRRIPESSAITRGELAALFGVHFEKLLSDTPSTDGVLVTDTLGHWAAQWIFAATRAGILDVYPNHTFQPDAIIRRGDLAQTIKQVLDLTAQRNPGLAEKWKSSPTSVSDVDAANLSYEAVSAAVASGILPLLEENTFQLSRPVSGGEAIAAIERLERLVQ